MREKNVVLNLSGVTETEIFNALIKKQSYKNLLDFCRKNAITYDPFRKRLHKNELFLSRSDLMLKICKGLSCTGEELLYAFKLAESDTKDCVEDIHIGTLNGLPTISPSNRKSGRIFTSLSPEEAHLLISLRMIRKLKPDGYEIATMVINTYTSQIAEEISPEESASEGSASEDEASENGEE